MRRDPRLIEFSREHHIALKLGRLLEKTEALEKAKSAINEHKEMLLNHFLEEEQELGKIIVELENKAIEEKFYNEHVILRRYLKSDQLSIEEIKTLGSLLVNHTRFEERELFMLIQNYWNDNGL